MTNIEPVLSEFDKRKRRQFVSVLPIGVLIVLVALKGRIDIEIVDTLLQDYLFAIVAVVVLGFFTFSLYNWRCPSCNRYLGQRLSPRQCPHCGIDLVR